jgi:GT2 family glycosyltransferase
LSVNPAQSLPVVVVPIHNGADALAACLRSLADTMPSAAAVELIDDASTDRRVAELLTEYAPRSGWRIVRQAQNLGFVATVNAAFARAGGDVVLLNSDTVLTAGWLQKIAACAASDLRIATITPFSNNAEICSFPRFCHANPVPDEPERPAQAAAALAPEYPDLPTAVGFCMFVRRAALDAVGDFDAATFGRGYGEENDFCLRAAGHGWRNVLCDDAYVVHVGGQSFAGTGHAPGGENLARLLARYPGYNDLIARFIAADPLAPHRRRLADRLEALARERVRSCA